MDLLPMSSAWKAATSQLPQPRGAQRLSKRFERLNAERETRNLLELIYLFAFTAVCSPLYAVLEISRSVKGWR